MTTRNKLDELRKVTMGSHLKCPKQQTKGRPKFIITKKQIVMLRECGCNWCQIASLLNISERTLYRKRVELNPEQMHDDNDDDELFLWYG